MKAMEAGEVQDVAATQGSNVPGLTRDIFAGTSLKRRSRVGPGAGRGRDMRTGIFFLVIAYVLSQFYRAFLPVMTPVLSAEIAASAADLSRASGFWFLTFAAMQIPVGWGLDTIGPRRLAAILLAVGGGGGAALFALAGSPAHIQVAMMLIGVGCSPVLMASYYIFARMYSPAVFATLAAAVIGVGSLGNIAGSLPMAWAVEALGWRPTVWGLAVLTLAVAAALWLLVEDPPRAAAGGQKGSVLDLLRIPALWAIFPLMFVNYAAPAGLRGLWAGPFLRDVHGLAATGIGYVTLAMGLAMVAGNIVYGPLDRLFGTRKWVNLIGNLAALACLLALWAGPGAGVVPVAILLAGLGFFGSSYAVVIAHGRSFFPAHLTGRGVTLMNLFGIAGVGLFQLASASFFARAEAAGSDPAAAYRTLFLFFALPLLAGCVIYLFSEDRTD